MCGSTNSFFSFGWLGSLFGYILQLLFEIFKNYGVAIILFTIFTRLLMFPMTIKQQKSMAAQQRLQPKLNELKNRYGNDREGYNQAMQELYQKENVSMTGGCLPMLLQLPLALGMYTAIRQPLSCVLHVATEKIAKLCEILGVSTTATAGSNNSYYYEVHLLEKFREYAETGKMLMTTASASDAAAVVSDSVVSASAVASATDAAAVVSATDVSAQVMSVLGDKFDSIVELSAGFKFLGFDLLQTASLNPLNLAVILAVLCFVLQVGSMIISNKMTGVGAAPAQGCNPNIMAVSMGAMSLWFAFITPAAFPLYWMTSSVLAPVQTWVTRKYFGPQVMNARAEAERNARLKLNEERAIKQAVAEKGELALHPMEPVQKTENDTAKKEKNSNNKKNNQKRKGHK